MNSSESIEILSMFIVLAFVAYNAVDRLVESSNQETVEIVPLMVDSWSDQTKTVGMGRTGQRRPWTNCQSPSRYVFLKKHKCASRYCIA